ncbi:MAG: ATPase [Nocardiopsaceae bacterium]|nr:ATPase [Nocardiopsaceae bacterium]
MSTDLPAVIAVDAGNSKTDVALVAADGRVLAATRGPGVKGAADLAGSVRVLADAIGRLQRQAGRSGLPAARHLAACMANADLPDEEERLTESLRAQGWTRTTEVVNDTFAVLRAGLTPADGPAPCGVAVTCGAGINCVGVAPDGRTTRFLSLGTITGDWGGGHSLGVAALWHAIRAEDGRGPETLLRAAVASQFGVATVTDVAIAIHRGTLSEARDLLVLGPVVFELAGQGDQVARGLVRKLAAEVVVMAVTALRRLGLSDAAGTPVVLGGGLLAARDPLLTAGIADGLSEQAPQALMRVTGVPPVAGAALLGLDRTGAGPGAERQLRAAYTGGSSPWDAGLSRAQ